jgi:hypothetical protein
MDEITDTYKFDRKFQRKKLLKNFGVHGRIILKSLGN